MPKVLKLKKHQNKLIYKIEDTKIKRSLSNIGELYEEKFVTPIKGNLFTTFTPTKTNVEIKVFDLMKLNELLYQNKEED